MNRDLEEQLNEMGPAYRAVVDRLRAGREVEASPHRPRRSWRAAYLVAASLLITLTLSIVFLPSHPTVPRSLFPVPRSPIPVPRSPIPVPRSQSPREYVMSVDEMIATQNPDGSWQNDFLTRRNAEALRLCAGEGARVAYKKAMRNLRVRGLL